MSARTKPIAPPPSDAWGLVAFRAGEATAIDGKPEDANPHPTGSTAAKNWRDGWRTFTARLRRS